MTKIKTAGASGAALDWLVAKCEGVDVGIISQGWVVKASCSVFGTRRLLCPLEEGGEFYSPSTIWEQGGPIIKRERISTEWSSLWDCWTARDLRNAAFSFMGPTPLIVAMRSFVASRLGEEVEVPDELA